MKYKKTKKVLVAMSGGVDSSVVALMLKKQGYEVIGVFMRLNEDYEAPEAAARKVSQKLGIKFYPVNLALKFKKEIVNYFIDSYKQGITPNPCVKCNKLIKFGELFRIAKELKCDYLATGHYVKKQETRNKKQTYKLFRGEDKDKDQTYFLYNLKQERLEKILFPLGGHKKDEIKKIAEKENLPVLARESQDVCFLNIDGKIIEHNEYLKKYIKGKPGPIKTVPGEVIGKHKGLPFYTIGQRKGVEIGGTGPFYVVQTDYKSNVLYVSNDHDDEKLYKKELIAKNINWIAGNEPKMPFQCEAVIRYRHKPVKCAVKKFKNTYKVEFDKPQRAVTSGQSVVFYQKDELLGGGIIS